MNFIKYFLLTLILFSFILSCNRLHNKSAAEPAVINDPPTTNIDNEILHDKTNTSFIEDDYKDYLRENNLSDDPESVDKYFKNTSTEKLIFLYSQSLNLEKEEGFKERLEKAKNELLVQYFLDSCLNKNINITDDQIADYYKNNSSKYIIAEQIKVKHIMTDNLPDAQLASRLLKKETAFDVVISTFDGGELGFFSKGTHDAQFEKAAFKLNVGEVSDIVQTKKGFHIIKVIGRKPQQIIALDQAKNDIKDAMIKEIKDKNLETLMNTIRENLVREQK